MAAAEEPRDVEGVSANHGLLVARDMKRCRLRKWGFVVSVLESVDGRRVATRVLLRANSGWYCSIARGGIPEGCSRWNRSGLRCDEVERGRWCRRAWCNFRLFLRRCTDAAQVPRTRYGGEGLAAPSPLPHRACMGSTWGHDQSGSHQCSLTSTIYRVLLC